MIIGYELRLRIAIIKLKKLILNKFDCSIIIAHALLVKISFHCTLYDILIVVEQVDTLMRHIELYYLFIAVQYSLFS